MELPGGTPNVENVKGSKRQTLSARRKTWSTHFGALQNLENLASTTPFFKSKNSQIVMELPGGTPNVEKVKGSKRHTFSARRKTWSTHFGTSQNSENLATTTPLL
jgi:hypothetical protein